MANPLNIHLSELAAKFVTRPYHLYAIPRGVNRWAVSLAYLTALLFNRSVDSIGLSSEDDAQFTASEETRRSRCPRPSAFGGLLGHRVGELKKIRPGQDAEDARDEAGEPGHEHQADREGGGDPHVQAERTAQQLS